MLYMFNFTHGLSTRITKHVPRDGIETEKKLLTRSHYGDPENNFLTRNLVRGESEARERDGKDLKDFWCSLYTFR